MGIWFDGAARSRKEVSCAIPLPHVGRGGLLIGASTGDLKNQFASISAMTAVPEATSITIASDTVKST